MIRMCDGKDPNLLKPDEHDDTQPWAGYVPCDCGLVFDDEDRMTIYPHQEV